ncbi:hypothetical protein KP509_1Z105900 [Ceratopteris richardii]|nr:hypothetical protein KP509_1Z105900 [Ceratopteris richardii]
MSNSSRETALSETSVTQATFFARKRPFAYVRVFFRVSELRVGQELYIADSALQMAALERNFMDVAELSRSRRVEPSKYYVIYSEIPEVPVRSFLPAELAEVIPLTNKSLSEIFKLHPSSLFAKNSMKTLQICNERVHKDGTTVMDGEAAVCTTSLEGLQTVLKSPLLLGPHNAANIRAVVTDPRLQCCSDFTGKIVEVRLEADEQQRHAICHSLMYPSAVYLCHFVPQGRLYSVTLKPSNADDEELVQAVGICHMDTRGWDPLHLAFLNVHTTPGHGEACHWLLKGSIAFVNNDAYQK